MLLISLQVGAMSLSSLKMCAYGQENPNLFFLALMKVLQQEREERGGGKRFLPDQGR